MRLNYSQQIYAVLNIVLVVIVSAGIFYTFFSMNSISLNLSEKLNEQQGLILAQKSEIQYLQDKLKLSEYEYKNCFATIFSEIKTRNQRVIDDVNKKIESYQEKQKSFIKECCADSMGFYVDEYTRKLCSVLDDKISAALKVQTSVLEEEISRTVSLSKESLKKSKERKLQGFYDATRAEEERSQYESKIAYLQAEVARLKRIITEINNTKTIRREVINVGDMGRK